MTVLNARACPRLVVDFLGGAAGHGLMGFGAGEEPGPWAFEFPIGTELKQQALRKQAVSIFVAFALVDTDEHAAWIALEIGELEPHDFTDAQASGIRGHE